MKVQFNNDTREYFIKEKIGKQTFYMAFQEDHRIGEDTYYFNIYMTLYNKRTQIDNNETLCRMTGENPLQTVATAIKAFSLLEKEVAMYYGNMDYILYCTWLNNIRRNVYEKFLTKKGFTFGNLWGKKCLYKKYEGRHITYEF